VRVTLPLFIVLLVGSAVIYPFWGESEFALYYGNVVQAIALIVAVYNLNLATNVFRPGDAPRKAWARIGIGIGIWVVAQILESYCDLVLHQVSYGTVADAFWMLGYFPLISGVYLFFENFRSTGLPLGNKQGYVIIGILLAAVYAILMYFIIWPNLSNISRPILVRILDFSYPTFDFIIIAVAAVLIRIAWNLRGGNIAKPWVLLSLGFVMTAGADILLQLSEDISSPAYRIADVVYFAGYFLVALSAKNQVSITAEKL
jgi:hypothetical protein